MGDDTEKSLGRMEADISHLKEALKGKASAESVAAIQKALDGRSTREWGIIATGIALVGTILAKNLGLM